MTSKYTTRNINGTRERNDVPVVIFCGGRGTRLKEETEIIPKPLVKIGGYPILWHVMKIYYSHGFSHFILPIGYKGEKIKEYFLNYASLRSDFTAEFDRYERRITHHSEAGEHWKVTVIDTGLETETGARLKLIEPYIKNDTFLLTYGDGVADVDISALMRFHKKHKKLATLTGVHPPARFGELVIHGALAASFAEKRQTRDSYINGGFFALNRDIFKYLNKNQNLNFEKDVLPRIAKKGELAVFKHDGYWQCMDTVRDMEFLNEEWRNGNAKWKVW